jgi:hypothetical protein
MPPNSILIDDALIALLAADSQLTVLCPDGIFFDRAPPGQFRFVVVSLTASDDTSSFDGRSFEELIYLVKAVQFSPPPPAANNALSNMKQAAARIDAVLEGATLTAAGFSTMLVSREHRARVVEVDERDPTIQWFHGGGWYRVVMST